MLPHTHQCLFGDNPTPMDWPADLTAGVSDMLLPLSYLWNKLNLRLRVLIAFALFTDEL
ncbi:hypothetical protein I1H34_06425 [Acaryochloris marina S15]|nr:hypothetical protein I1H34_06425 [Acaryochloris marina S15]